LYFFYLDGLQVPVRYSSSPNRHQPSHFKRYSQDVSPELYKNNWLSFWVGDLQCCGLEGRMRGREGGRSGTNFDRKKWQERQQFSMRWSNAVLDHGVVHLSHFNCLLFLIILYLLLWLLTNVTRIIINPIILKEILTLLILFY
jgi:hypothetical protein